MDATSTRPRADASRRVEKLSQASLKKIIDPDVDLPGEVGTGQVLHDELLSIHELPELAVPSPSSSRSTATSASRRPVTWPSPPRCWPSSSAERGRSSISSFDSSLLASS